MEFLSERPLKIFLLSASDEITKEVEAFAYYFGHDIVDCSTYFKGCLEDIIECEPDIVICASEIYDINTAAAIRILNHERKLSNCAVAAVQFRHERTILTHFTSFVPFEHFSFERMLQAAVDEKRSKQKPIYLLPEEKRINQRITNLLHKMGMTSDLDGYRFTHKALEIAMDDCNSIRNLSKNIYPIISKEYDINERSIDRMITAAITSSWHNCPLEVQEEIFSNSALECPSNKVYLATLAEYLFNGTDELMSQQSESYIY